jgi:hypothetical protein
MNTQQRFFAQYFARQIGYGQQDLNALFNNAYQALALSLTLEQLENANVQNLLKKRAKACVNLFVYAHWLGFADTSMEAIAKFDNPTLRIAAQIMLEA